MTFPAIKIEMIIVINKRSINEDHFHSDIQKAQTMHMCANFFAADAIFRHFALILGTNLGIKCHGASICAFGMSVIINIIRTIKVWQTLVYATATAILGRTN